MATEKPLNIDDEDLLDGAIGVKPMDQPTSMSYCLQRIRLGELCREITGGIPFSEPGWVIQDYQKLRDIDSQICDIENEMPRFFSLDYDANFIFRTYLGQSQIPISLSHERLVYRRRVPLSERSDFYQKSRYLFLRPEEDRGRREEIFHAFKILEETKDQSPFADRILESFYAVLWRKKVTLPDTVGKPDGE
ncbi:hypothetical protein N7486_006329 [Penicillium sp. IBT 16267x]|nr:hypothetical protein N7486_006329 [Penicillium sp. IBT 16267x]